MHPQRTELDMARCDTRLFANSSPFACCIPLTKFARTKIPIRSSYRSSGFFFIMDTDMTRKAANAVGDTYRSQSNLEQAKAYLASNLTLRAAIGADVETVLELSPLGMGEHNLNYRIDDSAAGRSFVLRINVASQPFHDDQVAYEYAALEALAPSGRTPQPLYLDNTSCAPGKGALVIGFCEGGMLDFDNLRPGDLRCAAQIMADVHAIPVKLDSSLHRPKDPLRELYEECLERFEAYRASAFEDARVTKWARRFIEAAEPPAKAPRDLTANGQAHVVNTETLPSHFLIPEASARAAAENARQSGPFCENPGYFVDWERPILGEVAQDIAYFVAPTTTYWDSEFLFPARDVEAFVDDYWRAVDGRFARGNFDERFDAWRKMTALRSVTWCCRALVSYSAESNAHRTEKTARKLPVYLSDDFMALLAEECFGL